LYGVTNQCDETELLWTSCVKAGIAYRDSEKMELISLMRRDPAVQQLIEVAIRALEQFANGLGSQEYAPTPRKRNRSKPKTLNRGTPSRRADEVASTQPTKLAAKRSGPYLIGITAEREIGSFTIIFLRDIPSSAHYSVPLPQVEDSHPPENKQRENPARSHSLHSGLDSNKAARSMNWFKNVDALRPLSNRRTNRHHRSIPGRKHSVSMYMPHH
jgi:hypothetical protein